jgi:hypothetical protein
MESKTELIRQMVHEGGKVVSPTHRPPLPPVNIPDIHSCWRLSRPQGHSAAGRVSLKVRYSRCRPYWPRQWIEGQLYPFLTSAQKGGGWLAPRPGHFSHGKDRLPIVQDVGWAPGPVWTCANNLAPTGIGSPDRPARSQSLYRLSCRGRIRYILQIVIAGLQSANVAYFERKIQLSGFSAYPEHCIVS